MVLQSFYAKLPRRLLWTGPRNAHGQTKVSGTPNCLIYSEISIICIHTHTHNGVAMGRRLETHDIKWRQPRVISRFRRHVNEPSALTGSTLRNITEERRCQKSTFLYIQIRRIFHSHKRQILLTYHNGVQMCSPASGHLAVSTRRLETVAWMTCLANKCKQTNKRASWDSPP
jgi:hypothetical protein